MSLPRQAMTKHPKSDPLDDASWTLAIRHARHALRAEVLLAVGVDRRVVGALAGGCATDTLGTASFVGRHPRPGDWFDPLPGALAASVAICYGGLKDEPTSRRLI
jgi:hypothetical protein